MGALPLTPLEVATGLVPGEGPPLPAFGSPAGGPIEAIEDVLRPALASGRCVVAFSGGLDSSLLLAVAVRLARRERLPAPAALTMRFPEWEGTDERAWQELVARHVGVEDWEVVHPGDELDLLGAFARRTLARHGLLWGGNAHVAGWLLERSRASHLVMGLDGDTALGHWRWAPAAHVRWGGGPLTRRRAPSLALAAAPVALRRPFLRSRERIALPWLTTDGQKRFDRAWLAERASEPHRWDHRCAWVARRRSFAVHREVCAKLGAAAGARIVNPLLEPRVLHALGVWGGRAGHRGRNRTLAALLDDRLLPAELLGRVDKAVFDVYWGPEALAAARAWGGGGVPGGLVDPRRLREAWAARVPDGRSALLLQAAWLAGSAGPERPESLEGRAERRPA